MGIMDKGGDVVVGDNFQVVLIVYGVDLSASRSLESIKEERYICPAFRVESCCLSCSTGLLDCDGIRSSYWSHYA